MEGGCDGGGAAVAGQAKSKERGRWDDGERDPARRGRVVGSRASQGGGGGAWWMGAVPREAGRSSLSQPEGWDGGFSSATFTGVESEPWGRGLQCPATVSGTVVGALEPWRGRVLAPGGFWTSAGGVGWMCLTLPSSMGT